MRKSDIEFKVLTDVILDNGNKLGVNSIWVNADSCDIVVDRDYTFTITPAKVDNYVTFTGRWTYYKGADLDPNYTYDLGKVNLEDNDLYQELSRTAVAARIGVVLAKRFWCPYNALD